MEPLTFLLVFFECILLSTVRANNQTELVGQVKQLDEKIDALRREVWSSTRNVPQHMRRDIEDLKKRSETSENTLDSLDRKLQLVITSLNLVIYDLSIIKQNVTDISLTINTFNERSIVKDAIQQVFQNQYPSNCLEIKQKTPKAPSAVYSLQFKNSSNVVLAFCEMEYDNGGWTVFHNRYDGQQDFDLDWNNYRNGFGNIAGEHWLGLEKIYQMTKGEIHELLVDMMGENDARAVAHYKQFAIGGEEEGYALKLLADWSGNTGDSFDYHAGSKFSTKDRDQDNWAEGNCAQSHGGGWWYKSCDRCNFNNRYSPGSQSNHLQYQIMYWDSFGGPLKGLKAARMLVRPRQ
ncbi:hypothetical protein ABEB36_001113 [Hypothenemus hampei]|uniref:Fibrinogen C-terminal domain-containing protein n=1 Tax=Hypothenemus hampei TaxID=57062 RepID=A0ABD1FH27_HYPHA